VMRRLIEDRGGDDVADGDAGRDLDPATRAFALDCLRAERPYETPLGRKQWVLAGIRKAPSAPRRAGPRVRFAFAAGLVALALGSGMAAARAGLPGWARRVYRGLTAAESSSPARWAPRPVVSRRPEAPAVIASPSEPTPPSLADGAAAPSPPMPAIHAQRHKPTVAAEDPGPVLLAMRVLRREHDPVRARSMAATYLREHPRGALAEEALAILVEAAAAHGDADAPELAHRYLRQYPTGAFRDLARRALPAE